MSLNSYYKFINNPNIDKSFNSNNDFLSHLFYNKYKSFLF